MRRQVLVGLVAGVALLVLDGLMNANPLARQLYAVYAPIARPSVDAVVGSAIDLGYGIVLSILFVVLWKSLPGRANLTKGMSFGVMVWFLRVCMRVAGEWVTTIVPVETHVYTLAAGLIQVLIVTTIIACLRPAPDLAATA